MEGLEGPWGYLSRGQMAVVPFPTTVPKSCSSATCPQTRSPAGQRGSRGPEWIKYSGQARVSRLSPLPERGAVAGLVFVSAEWAWQGRRLEEASCLVTPRWGSCWRAGVGITVTWQSQKPALDLLGLGSGILSALPTRRSPILTVSLGCGIQPGASICLAWGQPHRHSPKSYERMGSATRKELLPGSPLGVTCRELWVLWAFGPPG